MPITSGLLDRIRGAASGKEHRSSAQTAEDLVESVRSHLERLLNSRHGQALTAEDYGIPAMSEIAPSYPASVEALEKAIRRSIERYEPRLWSVRVRSDRVEGAPLGLRFHISGRLAPHRDRPAIWFETTFDTSGVAHVTG